MICNYHQILSTTKQRRMRWWEEAALIGEIRGVYRVLWGNLREIDHLEDLR